MSNIEKATLRYIARHAYDQAYDKHPNGAANAALTAGTRFINDLGDSSIQRTLKEELQAFVREMDEE